mmetsp:Transcript_30459/g.75618  ORF Transcript_30459/g.75618 Transcript_30459/m.75618 type:complete len:99 (-) Transcript_30459:242-538(-)
MRRPAPIMVKSARGRSAASTLDFERLSTWPGPHRRHHMDVKQRKEERNGNFRQKLNAVSCGCLAGRKEHENHPSSSMSALPLSIYLSACLNQYDRVKK